MVKVLTYDIPDHKIKLKIPQFQVMGRVDGQENGWTCSHHMRIISTYIGKTQKKEGLMKIPVIKT